ncbi:MAG: hypothetical protein ABI697_06965 [Devosia sp.]
MAGTKTVTARAWNTRLRRFNGFTSGIQSQLLRTVRRKAFDQIIADLPKINRTALVLGSGPNPTPPKGLDPGWFLITINASYRLARDLGLGVPDLTIVADVLPAVTAARAEAFARARTRLLVVNSATTFDPDLEPFLDRIDFKADRIAYVTWAVRHALITEQIGQPLAFLGGPGISNGVYAPLLALKLGAPRVVMTGFSLGPGWYPSGDTTARRIHAKEDRVACQRMAARGYPVFTSDPAFAEVTGLRLWEAA